MSFLDNFKQQAKKLQKTIVLPETGDVRTIEAAHKILSEGLAKLVLIGDEAVVKANNPSFDLSKATFVNPATFDKLDEFADAFYELRKAKGLTKEEAKNILLTQELFLGVMMVKMGFVDGMVAGAANATADVLRPSLQILKTAPNTKIVSAFFVMIVPDCNYGEDGIFVFSDCALNQNPNPEELAAIAGSSAKSFEKLIGKPAKVAMLSHSTMGSASHPDVTKVQEATRIAKELYPDLQIDGEMQSDAAMVPEIGKFKAPKSKIAGEANVLIFPDLDAANIGYKLVERLAKAQAFGPLTQGISKPVNDLSRGCKADDIVGVVVLTAIQAQ